VEPFATAIGSVTFHIEVTHANTASEMNKTGSGNAVGTDTPKQTARRAHTLVTQTRAASGSDRHGTRDTGLTSFTTSCMCLPCFRIPDHIAAGIAAGRTPHHRAAPHHGAAPYDGAAPHHSAPPDDRGRVRLRDGAAGSGAPFERAISAAA